MAFVALATLDEVKAQKFPQCILKNHPQLKVAFGGCEGVGPRLQDVVHVWG